MKTIIKYWIALLVIFAMYLPVTAQQASQNETYAQAKKNENSEIKRKKKRVKRVEIAENTTTRNIYKENTKPRYKKRFRYTKSQQKKASKDQKSIEKKIGEPVKAESTKIGS